MEIEISVLTPYKQVDSADDIVLGRDGVIIQRGQSQIYSASPLRTGWSKEVFLDKLCHKAGLQAGDWKTAQLFTFQAGQERAHRFVRLAIRCHQKVAHLPRRCIAGTRIE